MRTIPMLAMYQEDIAIYPDDENCNKFYCIRTKPKLRTENGVPVFSAIFWAGMDASTAAKEARFDGGEVTFDACLGITEEEKSKIVEFISKSGYQDEVIQRMEEELAEKKRARESLMEYSGVYLGVSGLRRVMEKGEIKIAAPQFSTGTVNLMEHVGGAMVTYSSGGSKPSLFGDNNAASRISLSPTGAEVWYRALEKDSKPLVIQFDLKAQVRLPSLEVHAYAGSYQKDDTHKRLKEVWEKVDKCTKSVDTMHLDIEAITREVVDNGIIVVDIRPSTASISSECIEQVRNGVMSILVKKIEAIMQTRFEGMTKEERESKIIEAMENEMRAFTEVRYTQEDVIEIPLAPQCSLMHFLEDLTDEQRSKALLPLDLRDSLFLPKREIDIHVNAPWDYFDYVIVKTECGEEEESFSFKKESTSETWKLKDTIDVKNTVYYTVTVGFLDGTPPYDFPKATSMGDITINLSRIGLIDVTFKPHPNLGTLSGKNKITKVNVEVQYENRNGGLDDFSFPLDFAKEGDNGTKFTRHIGKAVEKPLNYRVRYEFLQRDPITIPWKSFYLSGADDLVIYTPYPFEDSLDFTVVAPAFSKDSGVKSLEVDIDYQDEKNGFSSYATVDLTEANTWKEKVHLPIMDGTVDTYKYRFTTYGSMIIQSDWIDGKGEGGTVVLPIHRFIVMCNMLGLGTQYFAGQIVIESKDGLFKQLFFLDDAVAQKKQFEFYIQGTEDMNREFSYVMTLFENNSTEPVVKEGTWKGSMCMLPNPKPPQQQASQQPQPQQPDEPQQPQQSE